MHKLGEIEERFPEDLLIGVDEVGVSSLAGPLVAGAVMLDPFLSTEGIDDSKRLTEIRRTIMAKKIKEEALYIGMGVVTSIEVDNLGVKRAGDLARKRAVRDLLGAYDVDGRSMCPLIVVDGEMRVLGVRRLPQHAFIKGDQRSWNIAAASIVAKHFRDDWMRTVATERWPGYGFRKHKGYGTPAHLEKLRELGVCPIHRTVMAPVRAVLEGTSPGSKPRPVLHQNRIDRIARNMISEK